MPVNNGNIYLRSILDSIDRFQDRKKEDERQRLAREERGAHFEEEKKRFAETLKQQEAHFKAQQKHQEAQFGLQKAEAGILAQKFFNETGTLPGDIKKDSYGELSNSLMRQFAPTQDAQGIPMTQELDPGTATSPTTGIQIKTSQSPIETARLQGQITAEKQAPVYAQQENLIAKRTEAEMKKQEAADIRRAKREVLVNQFKYENDKELKEMETVAANWRAKLQSDTSTNNSIRQTSASRDNAKLRADALMGKAVKLPLKTESQLTEAAGLVKHIDSLEKIFQQPADSKKPNGPKVFEEVFSDNGFGKAQFQQMLRTGKSKMGVAMGDNVRNALVAMGKLSAKEINEIFGKTVPGHEMERAKPFVLNPGFNNTREEGLAKIKGMKDWAVERLETIRDAQGSQEARDLIQEKIDRLLAPPEPKIDPNFKVEIIK